MRLACSATRVTRSVTQGSTMNSLGSRSRWLRTVATETPVPGMTAAAWALTRWVSWSRSLRRNRRASMGMTGLLGWLETEKGRHRRGTPLKLAPGRVEARGARSHGGEGGRDVHIVTQAGDLAVAHGENHQVGQRELTGGWASPESFLLDDDRSRIAGVVDGQGAVALIS